MNHQYPDGKMNEDDLGAVASRVFIHEGRVVIEFGKLLSWLAFDKKSLRALIDLLESKYKQL